MAFNIHTEETHTITIWMKAAGRSDGPVIPLSNLELFCARLRACGGGDHDLIEIRIGESQIVATLPATKGGKEL